MKTIPRYLIRQLSVMSLYAMFALLALYSFFDIVAEAGGIGEGGYTAGKMAQYVLLQIPDHAYQLMPLAVLIGSLLALSRLAANSELTVIKTSGMSTANLLAVFLAFGLIFATGTALLGELAAPAANRYAENLKTTAKNGKISTGAEGLWIKEQNSIVNVREMLPDQTLRGIKAFRHNDAFQLIESWQADAATVAPDGTWRLENVRRSILGGERVRTERHERENWQAGIRSGLLDVLLVSPDQMSLAALTAYIAHLEENRQKTDLYRIEWWRKLMYPAATVVMAFVAFAFTPQSARHGNMGLKLFGGICLGLAFHFAGRLFGFTSRLYGIPPFLAAVLPTLLFAAWAVWLIRRHEVR
jgi:permease, yjgP/yjgQ family